MPKPFIFVAMLLILWLPRAAHADIDRGHYLTDAGDCASCHTAPGGAAMAGGFKLHAPFGTIYSTNITPDPDFGIGAYTLADFTRALRDGIARDGHHLYPAMPYPSYASLSDADIADLYDYFMHGVAPVAKAPPRTSLIFPFNQRWCMAVWDMVFKRHRLWRPRGDRDAAWNRGAYLVQTLGHCGACHTPRGPAYEEKTYEDSSAAFLAGSVTDNWASADLRGDPASGLGRWTEDDIVSFLKTGRAEGAIAFGNMSEAVHISTQYLGDDDLRAIAHYLKSISAGGETASYEPTPTIKNPPGVINEPPGAGLYMGQCASCHQPNGGGQTEKYPALAGNPAIMTVNDDSLIRILLEGSQTPTTAAYPNSVKMPAFAHLTDQEIADVLTYVRQSWGNHATPVTPRAVAVLRQTLENQKKQDQK